MSRPVCQDSHLVAFIVHFIKVIPIYLTLKKKDKVFVELETTKIVNFCLLSLLLTLRGTYSISVIKKSGKD